MGMRRALIEARSRSLAASVVALVLTAAACDTTPTQPVAPDTCVSRIAYSIDPAYDAGDIYSWYADGSGMQRLTNTGHESLPAWSPDGRKIAFVSGRTGLPRIWVMNADGSGQVALDSTVAGSVGRPTWSPDGKLIAYDSHGTPDGLYATLTQIYVVGADGSNRRQLTPGNTGYEYWEPAWSPDGSTIAFSRSYGVGVYAQRHVWLMNADGSNPRQLTSLAPDPVAEVRTGESAPAWSPDGSRLAFVYGIWSGGPVGGTIYVMGADGFNPTPVTTQPLSETGYQYLPAWSPDGRRLAFQSEGPGQTAMVKIINADGTGLTVFSNAAENSGPPAWFGCRPSGS